MKATFVLKLGNKYISEVWRRGCFDKDHKVLNFVLSVEDATVYESMPSDLENYRALDVKGIFDKCVAVPVLVKHSGFNRTVELL